MFASSFGVAGAAAARCHFASLDLGSHVHSEGCGHRRVEHGDHYDYLVDDELHHVTKCECADGCGCLSSTCASRSMVISHGTLSALRLRASARCAPLAEQAVEMGATVEVVESGPEAGAAPLEAQPRTTRIYAAGICCPMETPLVHSILDGMPGVTSVEVSVMTQTVTVQHDASMAPPGALVAALNGAMLDASLTQPRIQTKVRGRWLPPWNVLAAAALLLISLLHYLSGPTNTQGLEYLKYVSLGAVALCLPRIALRAVLALRRGVMDIHFLMTLACAGAIALADYSEAAAVVVLFAVAEHWERCSTDKARDAVAAVLRLRPESATLAASGELVPVEGVPVGTEVLVAPGESVPLDGVVVSGESALDESLLTGESAPVVRGPGSPVHAGTLNVGSSLLRVATTAAAGDTAVARMATLVEQAASQQSPAEQMVAKFARIYTPVVLVACVLLAFVPFAFTDSGEERTDWVYLSLQVLVTACPCALVLSTPAAVVCALACAAQRGVLIKSGSALERLRQVSVVTFDKTGTLTKGQFQVVHCQALNGWSRLDLLRILGSLERGSSHPLGAAVLGYAASQGVSCDAPVEDVAAVAGAGLTALVDGRRVAAGNAGLLARHAGVAGPELEAAQHAIDAEGATACFIAVDGQLAGWLSARDVVRPEAAEAVSMLGDLGCRAAMLTGDATAAAAAVGIAVGIPRERVHARLLPEEKLAKVAEYKQDPSARPARCCAGLLPSSACCLGGGRFQADGAAGGLQQRGAGPKRVWVAHIGDGVNDAPALAAADAGIAMGVAGSAAALEAGSVALFTNDVRAVPAAIMLARAAGATIWQNIAFAVITKVAVLTPAALGRFTLWGAVLVDVGAALLVLGNSLRLLKWRWPYEERAGGRRQHTSGCCDDDAEDEICAAKSYQRSREAEASCCKGSQCQAPTSKCQVSTSKCQVSTSKCQVSTSKCQVSSKSCCKGDHSGGAAGTSTAGGSCCAKAGPASCASTTQAAARGGCCDGATASQPASGSCCKGGSIPPPVAGCCKGSSASQPAASGSCCKGGSSKAPAGSCHGSKAAAQAPAAGTFSTGSHDHSHAADKGCSKAPQSQTQATPEPASSCCKGGHSHGHSHSQH